jgi:hypothetical protein
MDLKGIERRIIFLDPFVILGVSLVYIHAYIHTYTHTHTYILIYIPWILKFVMATTGFGISHKDT